MKKVIRVLAASLVLGLLFSFSAFADDSLGTSAFQLVNEIRAEHGLSQLTWDSNIAAAGEIRAEEITSNYSHTRPDGSDWYTADADLLYGENLAENYDSSSEVVSAWMNCEEHRENILDPTFTTGAVSTYEKDGKVYWAQEFGY